MSKTTRLGFGRHQRVELAFRPHRVWWVQALLIAWRWAFELAVAVAPGRRLRPAHRSRCGRGWPCSSWRPRSLLGLGIPVSRRQLIGWFWCTVTRHRLRTLFVAVRMTNGHGKLPWILLVRPTPVGERALCFMVAGLSVVDLENRTEAIAATCWARGARVSRSPRWAAFVWVDVIRRDPLAAAKPLPRLPDAGAGPGCLVPGAEVEPGSPGLAQMRQGGSWIGAGKGNRPLRVRRCADKATEPRPGSDPFELVGRGGRSIEVGAGDEHLRGGGQQTASLHGIRYLVEDAADRREGSVDPPLRQPEQRQAGLRVTPLIGRGIVGRGGRVDLTSQPVQLATFVVDVADRGSEVLGLVACLGKLELYGERPTTRPGHA